MRILGVNIPDNKNIIYSMCNIYGLGVTRVKKLLNKADIDMSLKVKNLTEDDITKITKALDYFNFNIEGDLKKKIDSDIQRLISIKSYRGTRHIKKLPTRGQRTKTNAKTRKKLKFKLK